MTKVFVHGNPETADIWGPLVRELGGFGVNDIVPVSPPGFGAPTPPGWNATPGEYVAWLAAEVEGLDAPIDLLGHDWGAGHVFGLAAERPDLIRSYACDIGGLLHPDYQWHEAARRWQTAGEGEQAIELMLSRPRSGRAAAYVGFGLPPDVAEPMAAAFDAEMGRCILALYRAAVQPALIELGDRLAAAERRPSLLIDATDDAYVASALTPAVAERLGSTVHTLPGQGHWWMGSDPAGAAAGLAGFWKSLD
jgi:pimeloyl-ACP methyl ester carboxylesterase